LAGSWAILEQIGSLTQRIRDYERHLEAISKERYPETELLRQVGALTVLTLVLTLEDPYRFEKSRSVGAYLGLVLATDRSGDRQSTANARRTDSVPDRFGSQSQGDCASELGPSERGRPIGRLQRLSRARMKTDPIMHRATRESSPRVRIEA